MVGRGIALLFHDRGTRRGWVVSSTPRPHFIPGKDPVPIVQEAGWVPVTVWTGGKSRPHRDSIPGRPARSQSLYRLSYPAHRNVGLAAIHVLACCLIYFDLLLKHAVLFSDLNNSVLWILELTQVLKRENRDELSLFIVTVLACQRRRSALNILPIPCPSKLWVYLKRWDFLRMITICCKVFNLRRICYKLVRNGTVWEIMNVMRKLTFF